MYKREILEYLKKKRMEHVLRLDGRVEWICKHGIGHTVWHPEGSDSIHGCDGCCKEVQDLFKY